MLRWFQVAIGGLLLCAVGAVAWRWASATVRTDVYSERLADLSGEYEALRQRYNQAVHRTAVTELIVKDNQLWLAIRTVDGVQRLIVTPFDPAEEIYCDYVLVDGRLWIRRVYDAQTPPSKGLVIDDQVECVDWREPGARYGKAVYRSLDEGRWIITVTGGGCLALEKVSDDTDVSLAPPPPIRDYDEVQKQLDRDINRITTGDVLKHLFASGK